MTNTEAIAHKQSEEEVISAVFKVMTDRGDFGTCFLIDERFILTAHHVVATSLGKQITINDLRTKREYIAEISKTWDKDKWDLALLELKAPITTIKPLVVSPNELTAETRIRIYGFPQESDVHWYTGKITGWLEGDKYEITFDGNPSIHLGGLSGSPVFFENTNSVVGLLYYQDETTFTSGRIVSLKAFPSEIQAIKASSDPWCYVILSEADKRSSPYNLRKAVEDAKTLLDNDPTVNQEIAKPEFKKAADLVTSLEKYREAVSKLCRAKIAIFDITNYEPVVMLFLGIRSVVRRGITIVSVGGKFAIGDVIDLPFNIKETNIISHSEKQFQREKEKTPPYLIRTKIKNGLSQLLKMPQYLDLPVFDAVRNLPPGYRELDPYNVLVLCSYGEKYQRVNWQRLRNELQILLDGNIAGSPEVQLKDPKVARILDLMSPRLVSLSIYESIRRVVLCIVDWTEWRPNVFFELGVRLAIADPERSTICIIEANHKQALMELSGKGKSLTSQQQDDLILKLVGDERSNNELFLSLRERFFDIAPQCRSLLKLFNHIEYNCSSSPSIEPLTEEEEEKRFAEEQAPYKIMMYYYRNTGDGEIAAKGNRGRIVDETYTVIEKKLDPSGEAVCTPVWLELVQAAMLYEVGETEGRAAVLYPGNDLLKRNVEAGIKDRFLAAWYYISNEFTNEEIIKDPILFENFQQISSKLARILRTDSKKSELAKEIFQKGKELKRRQKESKE
jgi:hypothetical protein